MESYQEFLQRINSFETPNLQLAGDFSPSKSLLAKVSQDNSFNKFYGDTTVFDLDSQTKSRISQIIDKLHSLAPECFAEKLDPDTIHMTLHDLSNSPNLTDVINSVSQDKEKIANILNTTSISTKPIQMRTNNIINMVNTSLVLALSPSSEDDYKRLMNLYELFDNVRELPYPLTPHVTLAYYNHNGFNANLAEKLKGIVGRLNTMPFDLSISPNSLKYQTFTDMNHYKNVIHFSDILAQKDDPSL